MDDFEREVSRTLGGLVAGMPSSYDASPDVLARARRRRTTKLGAFVAGVVIVATGTTAAVAQVVDRHDAERVVTTGPTSTTAPSPSSTISTTETSSSVPARASVRTFACPATYATNGQTPFPPPSTASRVPSAGDAALFGELHSFAATTDPRYVALGPAGWTCQLQVAGDGDNAFVVYPVSTVGGAAPDLFTAPLAIENDWLWHGGVGSVAACRVFDDPTVVNYVTTNFPQELPCLPAGRTVTKVDAHVSTFVDADGARGAGWMDLPSSPAADDGKLSVLTCRPTAGLTTADCDTIIADFVARNDAVTSTPATTTTPSTTTTQPPAVSSAIPDPPFTPSSWAATPNGVILAQGDSGASFAGYDAAGKNWYPLPAAPFTARPVILMSSGADVFVAGPSTDPAATQSSFAMLDLATGQWKKLAPIPDGLAGALDSCGATCPTSPVATGDANHLFLYAGINKELTTHDQREIALEYDVAANRWSKLPRSPLSFRYGSALQWTGTELLVWGGGDYQNGGAAFANGAAYDPATRKWRLLPAAPIPPSAGPANVWTGTQLLVWGGSNCVGCGDGSQDGGGAAYDPSTNTWTALPPAPLAPTDVPVAVWTGREMVLLGQAPGGDTFPLVAYDPATAKWQTLTDVPPSALARLQDNVAAYSSFVGNQAIFGIVGPGSQFAGFTYTIK